MVIQILIASELFLLVCAVCAPLAIVAIVTNHQGVAISYLWQSTASAINPKWTITGSATPMAATILSFNILAGGSLMALMGIGA